MTTSRASQGATILFLTSFAMAGAASAAEPAGGLVGWVEDTQGTPVAGAVISLFGKGIGSAGLVTLSDSAGRFFLPSLPAGSYTLRALGRGHLPAPARRVTVLPNQDAIFAVSLTPIGLLTEEEAAARARELRWLVRHKRRSVLEDRDPVVVTVRDDGASPRGDLLDRGAPWISDLAGTVEVVANPAALGVGTDAVAKETLPSSFSVLKLHGRFADHGRWSLGGLVAESESATWRMAAEFVVEPGGGHEIHTGAGYGSRTLRPSLSLAGDDPQDRRGVGAMFVEDHWTAGSLAGSFGARYSYVGYLADTNYIDPTASLELRRANGARFRGAVFARTLVPGGDFLTLSTLSSGPAIAYAVMGPGLRPEHTVRYEIAADRSVGPTNVGAHIFYEGVRDQLVNAFVGPATARSLRIFNGPGLTARGVGLSLARRFGDCVKGSVTYTYGRSARRSPLLAGAAFEGGPILSFRSGDFHDVLTRLETVIDRSDTRLLASYRINTLGSDAEGGASITNSRFDVQLRQGLPFLGELTRADWELLIAYRNLFYEDTEGATLDEVVVQNPPKRVLGGIAVRF